MLFASPLFLFLFLPIVLTLNYLLPVRFRNAVLLVASLFFYAWGEPLYVMLMLASISANYFFGLAIDRHRHSESLKLWLVVGLGFNLLLLVGFKYANFLIDNLNVLLQMVSIPPILIEAVHLPLGISFFTFQAMSYIADVYRGTAVVQTRFVNIALYISLFPQLIAGPIVRYHDVAKQIVSRKIDSRLFVSGIRRFVMGLAKKLLIANSLGSVADTVFAMPGGELGFALAWLGILCYALQIYFDFSGYSDMAIGLGRMFGFRFLENFNYPYIAQSLQDFWRRWHISLSGWFRDYLYISLGGNRINPFRTYLNLFIVFFLCGLWHGASWNFVIWGLVHGGFLVIERAGLGRLLRRTSRPFRHLYTLVVVCVAWVFFRAEELSYAWEYLGNMFAVSTGNPIDGKFALLAFQPDVILAFIGGIFLATPVYPWLFRRVILPVQETSVGLHVLSQVVLIFGLTALIFLAVASTTYNPFIYFRF
tara:strand:+ start:456 stop:1889 length:1434 start_codon:yes stop_codon:yes gene_type:complete